MTARELYVFSLLGLFVVFSGVIFMVLFEGAKAASGCVVPDGLDVTGCGYQLLPVAYILVVAALWGYLVEKGWVG